MDTVSKLDATFRRQAGIPLNHAILDFDSAAHGVNDTSEFDEDTSPVRLTTRPLCTAIVGSMRSLRTAR